MARHKSQSYKVPDDETVARLNPPVKQDGLVTFKVLHPVLGYKVGETFKATMHEVRFQLKHKSIEVA